jgi:hypothetical protein
MAISSIHIEGGNMGFFTHNDRTKKTKNSIFSDEENFYSCSADEAIKIYKEELAIRTEKYTGRTGRKLHKNTLTHLSSVVNLNQHHTEKDIEKICKYLEKTFDTKILQFSIHRDEGHISDDGEKIKNYHCHIEMMGLDSNGASVRKKFGRKELSQLQTAVAKLLKMERGINYSGEMKPRPTRLGTYEYKRAKEDETKTVQAKKKDLDEEIAKLRAKLQDQGAKRAEYAKLEAMNKQLKKQLKDKTLTIKQMSDEIDKLRIENNTIQVETYIKEADLKALNNELREDINLLSKEYDFNYDEWKNGTTKQVIRRNR